MSQIDDANVSIYLPDEVMKSMRAEAFIPIGSIVIPVDEIKAAIAQGYGYIRLVIDAVDRDGRIVHQHVEVCTDLDSETWQAFGPLQKAENQ